MPAPYSLEITALNAFRHERTRSEAPRLQADDDIRPAFAASPTLVHLLQKAEAAFDSNPEAARSALRRASLLLQGGHQKAGAPSGGGHARRGGLAPWQLRRVLDQVERHLEVTLSGKTLAAVAGLSAGHFIRAFKQSVGVTPHVYVMKRRISRAKTLMLETAEPLSQIALSCGFADQAHFTRVFKNRTGASPKCWRQSRALAPARLAQLPREQAESPASAVL